MGVNTQIAVVYVVVALAVFALARRVWTASGLGTAAGAAKAAPACSHCSASRARQVVSEARSALRHDRVGQRADALDAHTDAVPAAQEHGRVAVQANTAGSAGGDDVAGQ